MAFGTLAVATAACLPRGALAQANYVFTPIPGTYKVASGINNSGQIIGPCAQEGCNYLYNAGTSVQINLGGLLWASGINNSGELVGANYTCPDGDAGCGFLYRLGVFSRIRDPLGIGTSAGAINDHNQIVGAYLVSQTGPEEGFLQEAGQFTSIIWPNSLQTLPAGINNSGQVVGSYCLSGSCMSQYYNGRHSFLYQSGVLQNIDVPGSLGTSASGINDLGQISGTYEAANQGIYGYIETKGDFNTISFPYGEIYGLTINNKGQLAVTSNGGAYIGNLAVAPTAVNETANSVQDAAVPINLAAGASGSPTSATLVGSPVGGTVTGFPSTNVTFTPTPGTTIAGGFSFTLSNATGASNTAGSIVWPAIVSTQTKTFCAGVASGSEEVATAFEDLSIALEGGSAKQLAKNWLTVTFINIAAQWIASHDQAFGSATELSVGIHEFAEKAAKNFTKTNPLSIVAEIDSLFFGSVNLLSNVCVDDPPDQNYKVVARPQKLSIIKTGNSAVDKLQVDYWKYVSLSAAVVHAAERWQGATLANSTTYENLQQKAFNTYLPALMKVEAALNTDNSALSNVVPTFDINSFPGGALGMALSANAQCGKPLPSDLNSALLSLGMSQTQIGQGVCAFATSVTPATVNTNAQGALQVPWQ